MEEWGEGGWGRLQAVDTVATLDLVDVLTWHSANS